MTWTYSGDPSSSTKDKYRFKIADTDVNRPVLQDEEIEYLILEHTEANDLMYQLFFAAATVFARSYKKSLGPQSEDPTERLKFFNEQAEFYRRKTTMAGLSIPTYCNDAIFSIKMHDNV